MTLLRRIVQAYTDNQPTYRQRTAQLALAD